MPHWCVVALFCCSIIVVCECPNLTFNKEYFLHSTDYKYDKLATCIFQTFQKYLFVFTVCHFTQPRGGSIHRTLKSIAHVLRRNWKFFNLSVIIARWHGQV